VGNSRQGHLRVPCLFGVGDAIEVRFNLR
jgi:hypothetical protein